MEVFPGTNVSFLALLSISCMQPSLDIGGNCREGEKECGGMAGVEPSCNHRDRIMVGMNSRLLLLHLAEGHTTAEDNMHYKHRAQKP